MRSCGDPRRLGHSLRLWCQRRQHRASPRRHRPVGGAGALGPRPLRSGSGVHGRRARTNESYSGDLLRHFGGRDDEPRRGAGRITRRARPRTGHRRADADDPGRAGRLPRRLRHRPHRRRRGPVSRVDQTRGAHRSARAVLAVPRAGGDGGAEWPAWSRRAPGPARCVGTTGRPLSVERLGAPRFSAGASGARRRSRARSAVCGGA